MEKEQLLNVGYDLIYLAACALHGQTPKQEIMAEMSLSAVYTLARRHSMQAITSVAVSSFVKAYPECQLGLADETLKKWCEEYSRSLRKTIMFDAERENILAELEKNGIWYLPLKGIILQELYPTLGMRQMADNDILFDRKYRQKLRTIMTGMGYKVETYNKGAHDVYVKPPFMNFEMHAYLYRESLNKCWADYYNNMKTRMLKDETNQCGHHLSDEDFYVYITTHAYKHYSRGGNGVRSLMDVFVYLKQKFGELQMDYIDSQLKQLEIYEYEKMTAALANKLFSSKCENYRKLDELTEEEKEMLLFLISSGTYGRFDVAISRKIDKDINNGGSKFKYYFRRLFPDMTYYRENFPVVYKYKVLIPFFLGYRALKALLDHPKKLIRELKLLIKRK